MAAGERRSSAFPYTTLSRSRKRKARRLFAAALWLGHMSRLSISLDSTVLLHPRQRLRHRQHQSLIRDRKSVVQGKSLSERVLSLFHTCLASKTESPEPLVSK